MFNWEKKGIIFNPFWEENRPYWQYSHAQGENTLTFENFIRVYYCTREKPNEKRETISRIAYVDLDKKDLTKIINCSENPVLELGTIGHFDEFGTYPFSVIRIKDTVYGYYGGIVRCESVPFNSAIGMAISKDGGKTFQKIGEGPILSYSLHEPFNIGSPKVRIYHDKWYMTYSAGRTWTKTEGRPEVCYKLRMAISDDGINWKKLNKDLLPDKLGADESQACGDIIFKNNKYHMFYCYRGNIDFRNNPRNSYRIGYAYSNDMINWTRMDEKAGISISDDSNAFDSEMVAYPHIFEIDQKVYMLYLGNEVGKYGFALAELKGKLE